MTSARSFFGSSSSESEFATPRSTCWSGSNRTDLSSHNLAPVQRERSRDFRRFEDGNGSFSAPISANEYHTRQRLPPTYNIQQEPESSSKEHLEHGHNAAFSDGNHESGHAPQYDTGASSGQITTANQQDALDIFSFARHNKVKEVEDLLIRGVPVNATDENGNTILLTGCQNGSKRIAKLALRCGANINACNNRGNTALHFSFK
eukprot:13231082-Ditylum_brightwellii.AAC.1